MPLITTALKSCALDYWIGCPHWGQGHGTAAANSLPFVLLVRTLGIERITSACLANNLGSKRVLEKCGFVFTHEKFILDHLPNGLQIVRWFIVILNM